MLLATLALAATAAVAAPPDGIPADAYGSVAGKSGADARTGVVVTSDATGPVRVGLVGARCAVTLPRADWWLWRDGEALLRGHAGLLNVSIEAGPSELAPRAALEAWRERLRARFGGAIERAEIGGGDDGLVLAVLTDVGRSELHFRGGSGAPSPPSGARRDPTPAQGGGFDGVHQLALFAAKRRGPELVLVHLSAILPPGAPPPDEAAWQRYLTRGFVPDTGAAGRR